MPIFSSTNPALRARVLSKFPARVLAGNGMAITKSGGAYTFAVTAVPLSSLAPVGTDSLLGRDSAGDGALEQLSVGNGLSFTGAGGIGLSTNQRLALLRTTLYNNGSVLTTGVKADLRCPFSGVIQKATLLADQSGSIVVNIWKDTFANYPPTVADKITASAPPTLSSAAKSEDSTLTGWTTDITAGDCLRFNIDSVSTVTRVEVLLDVLVS